MKMIFTVAVLFGLSGCAAVSTLTSTISVTPRARAVRTGLVAQRLLCTPSLQTLCIDVDCSTQLSKSYVIPLVQDRTGIQFPYADVLYSDVYAATTKDLTHAYWVGKSTVDGIVCDHLAFAGPGIEWQIWLGPDKDPLPRRLAVTYLGLERQPRFLVGFSDWNLKAKLPASRFEFKKPAGAKPIEFRPLMTKPNN